MTPPWPLDHTRAKLCVCGHASLSHMGWQTYEKAGTPNLHPHACDILVEEKGKKRPCLCLAYTPEGMKGDE